MRELSSTALFQILPNYVSGLALDIYLSIFLHT